MRGERLGRRRLSRMVLSLLLSGLLFACTQAGQPRSTPMTSSSAVRTLQVGDLLPDRGTRTFEVSFESDNPAGSLPAALTLRQGGGSRRWDLYDDGRGGRFGSFLVDQKDDLGGTDRTVACLWLKPPTSDIADISCGDGPSAQQFFVWGLPGAFVDADAQDQVIDEDETTCWSFDEGITRIKGDICLRRSDGIPLRMSFRGDMLSATYRATSVRTGGSGPPALPEKIVSSLSGVPHSFDSDIAYEELGVP